MTWFIQKRVLKSIVKSPSKNDNKFRGEKK